MQRVVAQPHVLWAAIGADLVLMDPEAGQYIDLREVAAEVWREISERPRTIADLCSHLSSAYDAPPEVIKASVNRFVDDLLARNLARLA